MGIRIGYVMELMLVLAVGMGLTRWALLAPAMNHVNNLPLLKQLSGSSDPFLSGVALSGGLGLGVELLRRKSPPTWGLGRRTWSIAGLTVALYSGAWAGMQLASVWRSRGEFLDLWASLELFRYSIFNTFHTYAGLAIAAMGLTALIEGRSGQSPPDAREWAGRALLILIVAQSLLARYLAVFG